VNFPFVKGHGTENDFVVLPDLNGSVHGELAAEVVVALCDRRAGLGADGVLRVMRSSGECDWFMDYRNADGSVSEMCGNGIRVFARYLQMTRLATATTLQIDTRAGVKAVTFCDDGEISVDMGKPVLGSGTAVRLAGVDLPAVTVDMGNPHAVTFVNQLDAVGELGEAPGTSDEEFPHGVNVEFVRRVGPNHVRMRVFERGVGETRSCGTGACAAVVAAASATEGAFTSAMPGTSPMPAAAPGREPDSGNGLPTTYTVDVLGGRLTVTWDEDKHIHLKGPAVLVAEGVWIG
jgi:diaminopimelate epimerase